MTAAGNPGKQDSALDALQADIQQKHFSAALRRSTAMLESGNVTPALWALRGKALEGLQRGGEALQAYLEGVAQFPKSARLHLYAGHAHTRAGESRQALQHFQEALRISPSLLDAYRGLLNFQAIHPDSRDCARILAVAINESRSAMDRARACFLLGQISVDEGRDDIGFTYYRRANHIVGQGFSATQRQFVVPARALAIRRRHFSDVSDTTPHPDDCPAIIIAGLPRSGKSLVETLLARDPELLAGGELAYVRRFVTGLDSSQPIDDLARQLRSEARRDATGSSLAKRYRDFAHRARSDSPPRLVIDTSPANLRRIGFLSLLHPGVPVIFCRRDPLDLAVALYFKHFKTGHGYSYSLGAIGRAIARSEQLMAHWLRELPNPMATVHYEALTTDPEGTLKLLDRELGLNLRSVEPAITDSAPAGKAGSEWRLFPARSIDAHGAIRPDLIGFGARFSTHMQAALDAYTAEQQAQTGLH